MLHSDKLREPLSAVDAAWLRMDRPTNLMMICGMMQLDGRLELARLKELVRTRLLAFHRFRQRVVAPGADPHWEFDADFDLDWHVRRIALAHGALAEVMSELVSTALDPARPMWQFHLVDGTDGSAVVLCIHHCYGDGFALLHVVEAMTDAVPDQQARRPPDLAPPQPPRAAWERVLGPLTHPIGDGVRSALALAGLGRDLLVHPLRTAGYAARAADLLYQAGVIAAMTPDAATCLKGELSVDKRVAWGQALSLFEVKAVAEALACSVNDVLVACIAGALRAWLLEQGEAVADREVRALVPVNLRPPGPLAELGNHFGLVFLDLPLGIADPLERLLEVHRRMAALKQSQQPLVALGILAGMGVAPDFIKERVLDALAANASAVVTNVHGPDQPRYLAGRRIVREMFWVPQSGGIGLGISILSYDGEVNFGVLADTRRIPDPSAIPDGFALEFERLLLAALTMPWPAGARRRGPAQ
jgi:WS/DGAT/MGAT family acyltransferase